MTLTRAGCTRLWLSARERRPEPYEGRAACLTCEVGAAHAGHPVEAVPAWRQALRVVCTGCGRVSDRIILNRLCVSCRNRRLEAEKGRNGKGGWPRIVGLLFDRAIAVADSEDTRVVHVTAVLSVAEALLTVAKRANALILIGWPGMTHAA
jgi:hypothetical protein